jgi:hypothetical protein
VLLALAMGSGASCADDGADTSSGGEEESLPDCAIEIALAGGTEATFPMEHPWACGIPFGPDSGMMMVFIPDHDSVGQVVIDIQDVREGETGTFSASGGVISRDGDRSWSTPGFDCAVEIGEHVAVGEDETSLEYQVVGSGSCAAAADPVQGTTGDPISLGAFSFRFPAHWSKS